MKICGIIAEYNPFHNGHLYQIEESRKLGATHIAVAMSGNFVQRGEPAMFSKWARAEACLKNGVDLVIEIPSPFALSPARDFAAAGIYLLGQLGVSMLSFGSESGDIEKLNILADFCQKAETSNKMKELIEKGVSHPKAREWAVEALFGSEWASQLKTPNNLLGLEYLRAIKQFGFPIEPVSVLRKGDVHDGNSPAGKMASASWIRNQILQYGLKSAASFIPENTVEIYQKELDHYQAPCILSRLELPLLYSLRKMSAAEIGKIADVEQGMENRIIRGAGNSYKIEELIEFLKNRRYTRARVRRVLLDCLLRIEKNEYRLPEYIRVLGMNQKGAEILKYAQQTSKIPISSKFATLYRAGFSQAALEADAFAVYGLSAPVVQESAREFTQKTIVLSGK